MTRLFRHGEVTKSAPQDTSSILDRRIFLLLPSWAVNICDGDIWWCVEGSVYKAVSKVSTHRGSHVMVRDWAHVVVRGRHDITHKYFFFSSKTAKGNMRKAQFRRNSDAAQVNGLLCNSVLYKLKPGPTLQLVLLSEFRCRARTSLPRLCILDALGCSAL